MFEYLIINYGSKHLYSLEKVLIVNNECFYYWRIVHRLVDFLVLL